MCAPSALENDVTVILCLARPRRGRRGFRSSAGRGARGSNFGRRRRRRRIIVVVVVVIIIVDPFSLLGPALDAAVPEQEGV